MVKEKVKYIDGSTVEIEITSLGARKAIQLVDEYIPLSNITQHKDGDVSMNGNIKIFKLKEACLDTVKGLDLDKLESEEAERLYNKYFEKSIKFVMGQGGNPN